LAEHGFFAKELNTGWAEWQAEGLPTHGDPELAAGVIRCMCSMHPELVAGESDAASPSVMP
jgi:hypothetical protein